MELLVISNRNTFHVSHIKRVVCTLQSRPLITRIKNKPLAIRSTQHRCVPPILVQLSSHASGVMWQWSQRDIICSRLIAAPANEADRISSVGKQIPKVLSGVPTQPLLFCYKTPLIPTEELIAKLARCRLTIRAVWVSLFFSTVVPGRSHLASLGVRSPLTLTNPNRFYSRA